MRKNKGFTLIELLAVIVILAIIAVITVPKVAEMIDTSRKGSSEDAFYGAIKAAELGWAKALQTDTTTGAQTCTANGTAFSCSGTGAAVTVTTSGSVPKGGTISLDANGAASVTAANSLQFNGYYCCGNSSDVVCKRGSAPASGDFGDGKTFGTTHTVAKTACGIS